MNNENLSQKLCEICGIEPRMYFVDCGTPECMAEDYRQCFKCPEATPIEIYPDFEQPENFVKLLELKIHFNDFFCTRQTNIKRYINLYRPPHTNCKNFDDLEILIKAINGDFEDNNNIKQAIKDEEWVYE